MAVKSYIVKSTGQLITKLARLPGKKEMWFRGHCKHDWSLSPGYYRTDLDKRVPEKHLLQTFLKDASLLLSQKDFSKNNDVMMWMQHYGLPTRLLDWSESPLVALYFAVCNLDHDKHDGHVWVLDPIELNRSANLKFDYGEYIPTIDDNEAISYSYENFNSETSSRLRPIAIQSVRNNPRMQSQLGAFTIFHRQEEPLEEIAEKSLVRFVIPASVKKGIRNELELLAVNRFTLFPELSSIADVMKEKFNVS